MISDAQFSSMHSKLSTDGGFSASAKTGKSPTDGAMVAVPGSPEKVIPAASSGPSDVRSFAHDNSGVLASPGAHLGGWRHEGSDYLDVSQHVAPKAGVAKAYGKDVANADAVTSAADLGVARGEKAVYSVKSGRDVKALG